MARIEEIYTQIKCVGMISDELFAFFSRKKNKGFKWRNYHKIFSIDKFSSKFIGECCCYTFVDFSVAMSTLNWIVVMHNSITDEKRQHCNTNT